MSHAWSFQSFSQEKFDQIFGGSSADDEARVIGAITWEEGLWKDPDGAVDLARRIVREGVSYEGLPEKQARWLDDMLPMFFCPEGLEEELEVEYESPDSVAPAIVQEILARAEGKVDLGYLRSLERGRRYGQREHPPITGYFLLRPEEVGRLAAELRQLYELPVPWDNEDVAGIVGQCLVNVFETVAKKGKSLFGVLG